MIRYNNMEDEKRTMAGEILRALDIILSCYYDDKQFTGYGKGLKKAGKACDYLSYLNTDIEHIIIHLMNIKPDKNNIDEYFHCQSELTGAIIGYLNDNPDMFDKEEEDNFDYFNSYYNEFDDDYEERINYVGNLK